MANLLFKDMGIKIDDSTGALVDITAHVNSQGLTGALNILEDSALSDEERTYLPGMAGATIDLNGFLNSTTDGIFGPLVGNRTSITKTVQFQAYANRYYNGEVFVTAPAYSGASDTLETWSASLTFSGAVNRTSVALS